jgi:hypothetical protein
MIAVFLYLKKPKGEKHDFKRCIADLQYRVITSANVERNILYWNIGKVILKYSK